MTTLTLSQALDVATALGADREKLLGVSLAMWSSRGSGSRSGVHHSGSVHGYAHGVACTRTIADALDPDNDTCAECVAGAVSDVRYDWQARNGGDGALAYLSAANQAKTLHQELTSLQERIAAGKKVATRRFTKARESIAHVTNLVGIVRISVRGGGTFGTVAVKPSSVGTTALNNLNAAYAELYELHEKVSANVQDDSVKEGFLKEAKKGLLPPSWEGALPRFDETPTLVGFSGGFRAPNQKIGNLIEAFLYAREESKSAVLVPRYVYDYLQRSMSLSTFYRYHVTSLPAPLNEDGEVDTGRLQTIFTLWSPGQAGTLNDLYAAQEALDLI